MHLFSAGQGHVFRQNSFKAHGERASLPPYSPLRSCSVDELPRLTLFKLEEVKQLFPLIDHGLERRQRQTENGFKPRLVGRESD